MVIGVPKEIKTSEYRVSLTPEGVHELIRDGHTVLVQSGAGAGSSFDDSDYMSSGAKILDIKEIYAQSELILKVKEPLEEEFIYLRKGLAIFTYLHLAPNPVLTDLLLSREVTAFGYETLEKDGSLPLLAPMSEIAGRMAPIMGAYYLQKYHGGSGVLATGVPGVRSARMLVLGAGIAGSNAAGIGSAMGMKVTVISKTAKKLKALDLLHKGIIETLISTRESIESHLLESDIIVGAVLSAGARAPVLITRDIVKRMKKGAVIVDISVDQGGCAETTKPTTHDNPVYLEHGVVHYAVANMPGAYPFTSTVSLTNSTLPYIKRLASLGIDRAIREDGQIKSSLNIYAGRITHKALADSTGKTYYEVK